MFTLEALQAKHGDSLLLHYGSEEEPRLAVIDGGPGGVYPTLEKLLNDLRDERELAEDEALPIDLMMVSHLDADHITGILQLMRKLRDRKQQQKPLPWTIERFWHNAFPDLTGDAVLRGAKAASITASFDEYVGFDEGPSLLASVGQGRELRDLANFLDISGNKPFNSIVKYPHEQNPVELPGLELTVIGPDEQNLKILQDDWNKKVKAILEKEEKEAKAELAAYVDKSVYNLSSIVVIAKAEGKTMLLTGDARGDYTLNALRGAGVLKDDQPLQLDLLKLPHHGSDRNVDQDYFDVLQAKHYVISADGKHSNPDVATLEMIAKSRQDDDFTLWLTNAPEDFADKAVGADVARFFEGRRFRIRFREKDADSIRIEL